MNYRAHYRIICGLAVVSLVVLLTWFGVPAVSSQGIVIRSHFVEGDIPSHPQDPAWEKLAPLPIPLSGQVITRPVWLDPSARALSLRSFHNGKEIAFLMEWQDATKN